MSIEANTYEELIISNIDMWTAEVADAVSKYLMATYGIVSISLTVDGHLIKAEDIDCVGSHEVLASACHGLVKANNIVLRLRSCNGYGAQWRLESSFLKLLNDSEQGNKNITYRSIDYYDTDSFVDMYLFDENGLRSLQYTDAATCISDIQTWYCYSPSISIAADPENVSATLAQKLTSAMHRLCKEGFGFSDDDIAELLDDGIEEYGEMIVNGPLSFSADKLPHIAALASELKVYMDEVEDAEFEFEVYAVADGEDDYEFASVAITADEDGIHIGYCKF